MWCLAWAIVLLGLWLQPQSKIYNSTSVWPVWPHRPCTTTMKQIIITFFSQIILLGIYTVNSLISKLQWLSLGLIMFNQELQQKLQAAFLHPNQPDQLSTKYCAEALFLFIFYRTALLLSWIVGKLHPIYYELNLVANCWRMLFFPLNMFVWQVYGLLGFLHLISYSFLIISQVFASGTGHIFCLCLS